MISSNVESGQKEAKKQELSAPKKIGLMGMWGFGSIGNLAHQVAMIQNIRKYQPDAQIYGFSVFPEITQDIHKIPCFTFNRHFENKWWEGYGKNFAAKHLSRFSDSIRRMPNPVSRKLLNPIRVPINITLEIFALIRAYRTLQGFDMLIIAGGGHFDDVYGGAWVLPYALYTWSLMARLRRIDLLVVSNGVGPINEFLSRFFFKQTLSFASYRSYRDNYSKSYVDQVLHFYRKDDPVYPDLAHSVEIVPYQLDSKCSKEQRTIVGIAPIPHKYTGILPGLSEDYTSTYSSYLTKLASFAGWLLENQYVIFFFVTDAMDEQSVQDLKWILEKNKISYSEGQIMDQLSPISRESIFDNYMTQLAVTDLVVASRFHGVLLAQLLNKPTLALSFAEKTDCLMADTGQAEYCLSIDHFDVETIKERFIALEKNQATITKQLAERTHRYREALDEQYARLFSYC